MTANTYPHTIPLSRRAKIGVQTGERKVQREEYGADHVLELLGDFNGEVALAGDDEANHEATKDGMHTDDAREEGRCQRDPGGSGQ